MLVENPRRRIFSPIGTQYSPFSIRMNKKLLTPILILLAIALTSAREFWMQPLKFVYKPGEKLVMNLKAGENFIGEPWIFKKIRLNP